MNAALATVLRKARRRGPQLLRKCTQLLAFVFIVYAAAGGPWRNFKLAHNSRRLVELMHGEWYARLYGLNDDLLGMLGESFETSFQYLGMPWAATMAGYPTLDPILAVSNMLATRSFSGAVFMQALVPLLLALFLGKIFCSHICPMRFTFEIGQAIRRGLRRLGLNLPAFRSKVRLGGYVLLGGLTASSISGLAIWIFLLPYVGLSAGIFLLVTSGPFSFLLGIATTLVVVDMLAAPGFVCHNLCPTGFLLEQIGRFAPFRLRKTADTCPDSCTLCTDVCPYALKPRDRTHTPACDGCGACSAVCPKTILERRISSPRAARALPIVTSLVLVAFMTATASAHHNKGLPHYGYYENYPQVPTEETIRIQQGWEIGATVFNFQGLTRRDADTPNDVKIYLYMYDLKADKAYGGGADFEIQKDGETIVSFTRASVDEEAVYSTRETLPESGQYVIVAKPHAAPKLQLKVPFTVDLAADAVNWWLVLGLLLPVLLLFGLALHGRSRHRRLGRKTARKPAAVLTCLFPLLLWGPMNARASPGSSAGPSATQPASYPASLPASGPASHPASLPASGPASLPHAHDANGNHSDGTMAHYTADDGGEVMVMGGIPSWLFLLGIAGIIIVSYFGVEWLGAPSQRRWRYNLLKNKRLYKMVRGRWFQSVPQLLMVLVFVFLIYAGLFGSGSQNITPIAVWTVWWAGLIFAVAIVGPAFCFACPWDGLSNLMSRLRLAARVEPLNLGFTYPAALQNLYPAIALFALLTWLELGFGITTNPRTTAYMGLGMGMLAVAGALLFDGKRFCQHMCPVGRISGIYANFSPVEIRAKNPNVCARCTTEDCLNGNEAGYACPTGISLKVVQDATYCTMCTECLKSCDKLNVAVNLRPFGADLANERTGRLDEAWLSISLLALTLFHGLSMTPAWENFEPGGASLLKWMSATFGTPKAVNFTFGMLLVMAVPVGLYWLSAKLGAMWAKTRSSRELFIRYSYSVLPVALFYHLAHNAMHLFAEGGEIIPRLSDPLGTGTNYFGTRDMHFGSPIGESTLWYLQVGLILVGHLFGIIVAHRIGTQLFSDKGSRIKSLIPMLIMMVVLSVCGLGLMHLDMNMRVGRM